MSGLTPGTRKGEKMVVASRESISSLNHRSSGLVALVVRADASATEGAASRFQCTNAL